jgi:hypothetical protein
MNVCLFLKMLITLLIVLNADNTVLVSVDVYTGHSKIPKPQVIDTFKKYIVKTRTESSEVLKAVIIYCLLRCNAV